MGQSRARRNTYCDKQESPLGYTERKIPVRNENNKTLNQKSSRQVVLATDLYHIYGCDNFYTVLRRQLTPRESPYVPFR